MRHIQPTYLPCIQYFGLPISVSCPVYRNVNDEECLPLVSVSKKCIFLLWVQNDVHMNQKQRRVAIMTKNFCYCQKWVRLWKAEQTRSVAHQPRLCDSTNSWCGSRLLEPSMIQRTEQPVALLTCWLTKRFQWGDKWGEAAAWITSAFPAKHFSLVQEGELKFRAWTCRLSHVAFSWGHCLFFWSTPLFPTTLLFNDLGQ